MQEDVMQKLLKDLRRRAKKRRSSDWSFQMFGLGDKQRKRLMKFWSEGI